MMGFSPNRYIFLQEWASNSSNIHTLIFSPAQLLMLTKEQWVWTNSCHRDKKHTEVGKHPLLPGRDEADPKLGISMHQVIIPVPESVSGIQHQLYGCLSCSHTVPSVLFHSRIGLNQPEDCRAPSWCLGKADLTETGQN